MKNTHTSVSSTLPAIQSGDGSNTPTTNTLPNLSITGTTAQSAFNNYSSTSYTKRTSQNKTKQALITTSPAILHTEPISILPSISNNQEQYYAPQQQQPSLSKVYSTSPLSSNSQKSYRSVAYQHFSKMTQKVEFQMQEQENEQMDNNEMETQKLQQEEMSNNSQLSNGGRSVISSTSSKSINQFLSHGRYNNKKPTKQQTMQEFIRKTLEKTRINPNEQQPPFSSFSSYPGTRDSGATNQKMMVKQIVKPLKIITEMPGEYQHIQSRVKQDIVESQKKSDSIASSYFSIGKSSYPKYKPPEKIIVDPIQQRRERMQNFLRKAQGSLSMQPKSTPTIHSKASENLSPRMKSQDTKVAAPTFSVSQNQSTTSSKVRLKKVKKPVNNDEYDDFQVPQLSQSHNTQEMYQFSPKNSKKAEHIDFEDIQEEIVCDIDDQQQLIRKIIPGQPRNLTNEEIIKRKIKQRKGQANGSLAEIDRPAQRNSKDNTQFKDEEVIEELVQERKPNKLASPEIEEMRDNDIIQKPVKRKKPKNKGNQENQVIIQDQ